MKTIKIEKCTKTKAKPNAPERDLRKMFCSLLWETLKPEREVGLSPYVLTKMFNMETNLAGVVLKTTLKDKGILLNFCPFCGTNIEAWLEPHLKKSK